MELLNGEIDRSPIVGFCKAVISRHAENWPPKEEVLAEEFVQWFGLQPFSTRDRLIDLCLSKRVNLSFAELPPELSGVNCSFQDKTEIVINERQTLFGADLHTLLHEFQLGYATLGAKDSLEVQAEIFAVSARIEAVKREIPAFIETVENVQAKWARYLSYGVLGVLGFIYLLSCVYLPHLEEIDSKIKRQRYVRT